MASRSTGVTTFVGVLLQKRITGTLTDEATISQAVTELMVVVAETGVLSYLAHAFYNSAFKRT